jgi:hypothetical protein
MNYVTKGGKSSMKKNFFNKATSIVLTVAMILSMSVTMSFATDDVGDTDASSGARASGYWSSYTDTTWYNDTDTTFNLTTASQLAGLAKLVSDGNSFADKTVKLGADIDLSDHYWLPIGGNRSIAGNTPTGTRFEGTFDGGTLNSSGKISNYNVTGLTISWNTNDLMPDGMSVSDSNYSGFGLFGVVGSNGLVENLNVSGSITSNARMYAVGGVVGYSAGDILNCQSSVNISITSAYSARTGGVAGEIVNASSEDPSKLQFSSYTGTLKGARSVGGIVGSTSGETVIVDNCYNTGSISTVVGDQISLGGIAGYGTGYFSHLYSAGTITLTSSGGNGVGGLIGRIGTEQSTLNNSYAANAFSGNVDNANLAFGSVNGSSTVITNVLWCPDVAGSDAVTQPIASGYSSAWGRWTRCGTSTLAGLQGTAGGMEGMVIVYTTIQYGYSIIPNQVSLQILGAAFTRVSGNNNNYPILKWQTNGLTYTELGHTGSGTETDPWRIYNQQDLEDMHNLLGAYGEFEGQYFKIMNNITLEGSWTGIGSPEISTASSNSPYVSGGLGFAGTLDGDGKTISISRSAETSGVGGLINYLTPKGTVKNLTVEGTFTVSSNDSDTSTSTSTSTIDAVGGIVGYNSGTIDNVTNKVTVTASDCYNVGGIAGFNNGYYNTSGTAAGTGEVSGYILNSSNTGAVSGYAKIGGITGENSGVINSCWNTAAVSSVYNGRSGVGGIAGRAGNNGTAVEKSLIWNCYNTGAVSAGEGSWAGGICGFENSLSVCANSYDTGNVAAYKYNDAISGDTEGVNHNCYYLYGTDGVQGFDGSSEKGETALRGLTSTLNSGNNANIWVADSNNVNNGYPVLAGIATTSSSDPVPDGSYTIVVYRTPDKMTYTVGETFSSEGLQIRANYIGSHQDIDSSSYTVTPPDSMTVGQHEVKVDGTYSHGSDTREFHFVLSITVQPAATTENAIYLNGESGNDSNNGTTTSSAVKTLAQAVSLAGTDKTIWVTGTVKLDSAATYNPNVAIKRYTGEGFTGPMFVVNAGDTSESIAYVTMTGANIDGSGVGNVFEVNKGRLRLRGGITVTNTNATAVYVNASGSGITTAQAELNYGTITAGRAVEVAATTTDKVNNFIVDNFGFRSVAINGTVYLGDGSYITAANNAIPCDITVECASPAVDRVVAVASDYTLTNADAYQLDYPGNTYGVMLSTTGSGDSAITELVLAAPTYLGGTTSGAYTKLDDALDNTAVGGTIFVGGTIELSAGTYSKDVLIKRADGFSGNMFNVSASGGTATMSGMTVNGRGTGTISAVAAGTLELAGGVKLNKCQDAVNVASGAAVTVTNAIINAAQYSVKLTDATSIFNLTPSTGTSISGIVYLPTNNYIRVGSTLTALSGTVTIGCETPSNGLQVAYAASTNFDEFSDADAAKLVYQNDDYIVVVSEDDSIRLILSDSVNSL